IDDSFDAAILTSSPGVWALTGARMLAEIGDDRSRFTEARNLRAYAGSAPVTRTSGKILLVMQRKVKNQRLAAAGYTWAFAALTASPHARAHYDRRRAVGDGHAAALRNLIVGGVVFPAAELWCPRGGMKSPMFCATGVALHLMAIVALGGQFLSSTGM